MSDPINLRGLERTAKSVRERVEAGVPHAMHVTTDTMLALVAAVRASKRRLDLTNRWRPELTRESVDLAAAIAVARQEERAALARVTDEEPTDGGS